MRIYEKALEVVRLVVKLCQRIGELDPDLVRQMKKASMSVPLNMQEGMYSQGGNRIARFHNAMASARETMACLHVAVAAEYVNQAEIAVALEHLDHVIGGLWKLSRKRSR